MKSLFSIALLMLLIAGCGPSDTDDSSEPTLLKPQSDALEAARGVEDDVLEAARRQREQIDEQD